MDDTGLVNFSSSAVTAPINRVVGQRSCQLVSSLPKKLQHPVQGRDRISFSKRVITVVAQNGTLRHGWNSSGSNDSIYFNAPSYRSGYHERESVFRSAPDSRHSSAALASTGRYLRPDTGVRVEVGCMDHTIQDR